MGYLARGMNTGVSSPRTDTRDRLISNIRQRFVQTRLNTRGMALILPPVLVRAVVFDADSQAAQNYPNPASSC